MLGKKVKIVMEIKLYPVYTYINLFYCIQHFTNNIRIDRVHYLQSALRPHNIVRNAQIKKRWNTDKFRLSKNVVQNTRIMDDGFCANSK